MANVCFLVIWELPVPFLPNEAIFRMSTDPFRQKGSNRRGWLSKQWFICKYSKMNTLQLNSGQKRSRQSRWVKVNQTRMEFISVIDDLAVLRPDSFGVLQKDLQGIVVQSGKDRHLAQEMFHEGPSL